MQMPIKSVLFLTAIVCFFAAPAIAQPARGLSKPNTAPPPQIEPVDPTYVPTVESKTQALEVVSVVRREFYVRIKIKNVSAKNIYSFRMSYYKTGASQLFSFVLNDDQTFLAPGEIYKYDHSIIPSSPFAREPLTFQAVLFEDGTGDGEPDKVKSLQDIFMVSRKELEQVLLVIQSAIDSPEVETVDGLATIMRKLSEVPDYTYGVDLRGLAGLTLPTWRATGMGLVRDIEQAKYKDAGVSIRERLVKVKEGLSRTLAKYPRLA